MQRWFLSLAVTGAFASAAAAQVEVQVQGNPAVQARQAQVQLQLQVQAIQVQGKIGVAAPMMYNQTKLTQADAIFVGRVVAIEPMDVETIPAPGQAKVNYRIAVVQVTESIFGLKKGTQQVRIGFVAQAVNGGGFNGGGVQIQPAFPPNGLRRPFQPNFPMQLQVGQDGMFAVAKHHKENFYLAPNQSSFITREGNQGFDAEVKTAKQLAKVMGSPVAALKADDKQDRYLAAAILVTKYRNVANPTGKVMKQEPIDAEESKLILQAIAGGDWTPGRFNATVPNPFELFNQLGITPKDGYNLVNVRTQQDIAQHMQKWLDENNGKYRINRQVADPNAKAGPVGVQPQPGVIRINRQIQPLPPAPVPEK